MKFCIVSIILYLVIFLYGGYLSTGGPASRKAFLKQCEMPTLKNGVVRLRQKGRLIKFQCYKSYTLIGSIYAGCVGGKWDTQFPICAKAGCDNLENRDKGFILIQRRGLMASLFCEDQYKVAGVQTVYCDGARWDRPIGSCRASTTNSKWCDFEVDDLCGWTHDNTHDFDWKRVIGAGNLKRYRTGPQHDHTTMIQNGGHYMLVESINQLPDDRARLISPVYSRNLTTIKCFRFYYHMYGATVGTLRVYLKPSFIEFDTMLKDQSYVLFEISGNRGNHWHEKIIRLGKIIDDFQIIFEGTAGNSHLSDIAIDDVALLNEDECPQNENEDQQENNGDGVTTTEQGQIIFDVQSCKNRCEEKVPVNESVISTQQGLIKTCDCHSDCEDSQTCCSDYRTICVFEADDDDIEYSTKSQLKIQTTTEMKTTTTPSIKTTLNLQISSKQDDLNTIVSTKIPKIVQLTTEIETTTTTTTTTNNIFKNVTTAQHFETTFKILSTPSYIDDISYAILSTTNSSLNKFENTTWDTLEVKSSWNEWQISSSESKNRAWIPTWVVILLGIFGSGGILSFLVFLILYYRKRYGPENYIKRSENASRNVNEEFSDVRFLTCDEHLDFTLRTPETMGNLRK